MQRMSRPGDKPALEPQLPAPAAAPPLPASTSVADLHISRSNNVLDAHPVPCKARMPGDGSAPRAVPPKSDGNAAKEGLEDEARPPLAPTALAACPLDAGACASDGAGTCASCSGAICCQLVQAIQGSESSHPVFPSPTVWTGAWEEGRHLKGYKQPHARLIHGPVAHCWLRARHCPGKRHELLNRSCIQAGQAKLCACRSRQPGPHVHVP